MMTLRLALSFVAFCAVIAHSLWCRGYLPEALTSAA